MVTADIENLSASELKQRRVELTKEMSEVAPDALASRYVQARLDAKMRDEKLAEQGTTITLLQSSLEEKNAQLDDATTKIDAANKQIDSTAKALTASQAETREWKGHAEKATGDLLKVASLAKRRREVLAQLVSMISPLLVEE